MDLGERGSPGYSNQKYFFHDFSSFFFNYFINNHQFSVRPMAAYVIFSNFLSGPPPKKKFQDPPQITSWVIAINCAKNDVLCYYDYIDSPGVYQGSRFIVGFSTKSTQPCFLWKVAKKPFCPTIVNIIKKICTLMLNQTNQLLS